MTLSSYDMEVDKYVNLKVFAPKLTLYVESDEDILICDLVTVEETKFH